MDEEKKEEASVQPIDDKDINDVVGGSNPFADLPRIGNSPIDDTVTSHA